jgi:hypothetical protein
VGGYGVGVSLFKYHVSFATLLMLRSALSQVTFSTFLVLH